MDIRDLLDGLVSQGILDILDIQVIVAIQDIRVGPDSQAIVVIRVLQVTVGILVIVGIRGLGCWDGAFFTV